MLTYVYARSNIQRMSHVQLALRVSDLDAAVGFYSRLFATPVAKRRPGYANFAIAEPPLKLVLIEGEPGEPTRLDHLGVEVESADLVAAAGARLDSSGLATEVVESTTCCYALQDKVWVTAPGGEPWEIYTVLADDRPELEGVTDLALSAVAGDGSCCEVSGGQPGCC
jgi:catechol 2,3-dioxygenase-like lactoylglutathione lyase family enzyme